MKKISKLNSLSRREFMKLSGGCATLTQSSLIASILNLQLSNSAIAATDTSGYKALVCIFLHGGNDSFNTLIPADTISYAEYQQARGSLALPSNTLLGISDAVDGRSYGLHPGLHELQQLYTQGLSLIHI